MSEQQTRLGRLEPVKPRSVWLGEATDFTPWLSADENIGLLGDTVGIDLEVQASEQHVRPLPG